MPINHADFDLELRLLLEAIYHKYQHDFRNYSASSLRRRMAQALTYFRCRSLSQLQDRVLHDPDVFPQMLQFLTVQVSEMFRDPRYFKAIRDKVVPILHTYPWDKIWVGGCRSGEELWSLAILMEEEGLANRTLFYATDINPEALRLAEAGIYPTDRIAGFSKNYLAAGGKRSLSDYYHAAYGAASFARGLKSQMVFANHSLATDSVFSEVHMVSCRNVLIYFNHELQDRAVTLFKDALIRRGFLGLGSKESLRFGSCAEDFDDFAPQDRIFQKR